MSATVLGGVVDAADEPKIVRSVAVAIVLAPVHGALQKIELAVPEHGVAGVRSAWWILGSNGFTSCWLWRTDCASYGLAEARQARAGEQTATASTRS